jgi:hypothetical protein
MRELLSAMVRQIEQEEEVSMSRGDRTSIYDRASVLAVLFNDEEGVARSRDSAARP